MSGLFIIVVYFLGGMLVVQFKTNLPYGILNNLGSCKLFGHSNVMTLLKSRYNLIIAFLRPTSLFIISQKEI